MLLELSVENYAVIESVRVRFHAGLNLLTGETGSGKSIVVDALGLLLGGRASADMVRAGADRARITGIFEVTPAPSLRALLDEAGIEMDGDELLIEREIQTSGKSRAFVCNRPATAALLRELAGHLADIHGQHDQQQLFSTEVQCQMLDAFAQADAQVAAVATAYARWRKSAAELEDLDRSAQEKLRMADLWTFQRNEIEAVAPRPGEDAELDGERRVLRNVVKLQELAGAAFEGLHENPESVSTQLSAIRKKLDELARIDPAAVEIAAALEPAAIAVEETARALGHYAGNLEADPARLDEVEARLAAIERLKRKYGSTIEEILVFLDEARQGLAAVETADTRRAALEKETAAASQAYEKAAAALSATRRDAAQQLSKRVEKELAALAMEKSRVRIEVQPAAWSPNGSDMVAFLISPNPGEEPKPLEKIASGGELSRVALALKTCTAGAPSKGAVTRTMVFDEVDAGVGGSAAESVGRRLKKLAGAAQVICVTHLPQIAGFADHHYFVEKHTERGRTLATIAELNAASRTREIGRMLSGEEITPEALRHAERLRKMAAE